MRLNFSQIKVSNKHYMSLSLDIIWVSYYAWAALSC